MKINVFVLKNLCLFLTSSPLFFLVGCGVGTNGDFISCENKNIVTVVPQSSIYFEWKGQLPDRHLFSSIDIIQSPNVIDDEKLICLNEPVIYESFGYYTFSLDIRLKNINQNIQRKINFDINFKWQINGKQQWQRLNSFTFFYRVFVSPPAKLSTNFHHTVSDNYHFYEAVFAPFKICDDTLLKSDLRPFAKQKVDERDEPIENVFSSIEKSGEYFSFTIFAQTNEPIYPDEYFFEVSITTEVDDSTEQIFQGENFSCILENGF